MMRRSMRIRTAVELPGRAAFAGLAVAFVATDFLTSAFFAGAFLAATFLATVFLATVLALGCALHVWVEKPLVAWTRAWLSRVRFAH